MLRYKINNYNELAVAGDGDWIEYIGELDAMSELKDQGQAIVDRYEARLKEKDKEIERLKSLVADLTIGCMDKVEVKEDMDRKEKKPKKRRWKFLRTGLKSNYNGFQWEIGKWETTECERLCVGFNCSNRIIDAMRYVSGEILAEVESSGKCFEDDSKSTHEKMRIVNAWNWRKEDSVELAIYAAEMVIHIFEDKNPYDDRPRKAIEAAKSWLAGKSNAAANAAADAAASAYAAAKAANASDAATYAADVATYAAANAASYTAAYAFACAKAASAKAAYASDVAAYASDAAAYAAASTANAAANATSYAAAGAKAASAADKSVTDKIESWLLERVKHLRRYREAEVGNEEDSDD